MLSVKFLFVEGCPIIAVFYGRRVRAIFLCSEKRKLKAMVRVLYESAKEMAKYAEALRAGS